MIKKTFHFICFLVACGLWAGLLGLLFQFCFAYFYHIDVLSVKTYHMFSVYWNNGGVLKQKDLLMFFVLILYIPLCLWAWYRFYHFKFMKLITVPINWIANIGADKYEVKEVNIKNLKVEEKKTIDQIVQERLEKERKKNQTSADAADFRKKVIEKITEGQN